MKERLTNYQRRLFIFLGVATFFEGYDFIALTQILPELRDDFGLSKFAAGAMVAFINLGTVVAYVLVRKADEWGRRRVLTITIAGYTVFTVASGLAPDPYTFAIAQFLGRIFLIGEWAVSMIYAAEEFPAHRRGMVIGVLSTLAALGSIVCAGTVPMLVQTDLGWRLVYLVAVVPLVILAIFRRSLRESSRFQKVKDEGKAAAKRAFGAIFDSPYRNRVLLVAAVWALTYTCSHTGVTFFKDFAVNERGFTDVDVGRSITIAALAAMPLVLIVGPLMDRFGRKPGAVIVFTLATAGIAACYNIPSQLGITVALIFAVFGASALPAVLNTFTTELFPTDLRAEAFAWGNNLLGRIGYVIAPFVVGAAADRTGWGLAVTATTIFPFIALAIILVYFPETASKELEETSAVPGKDAAQA